MRIEQFNRGLGDSTVREDLRNGKIHMVFLAANGLTFFNVFAVNNEGISHKQATQLCRIVNEKNETGTLYPKLNISILPLSRYENRDDWENKVSMKKNIEDAFKANSLHIQSKEIVFAFDTSYIFNNNLALEVLEDVAKEIPDNGILEHIYYIC